MTAGMAATRTLSDAVAEEIRALMARRRIRQSQLARILDRNGQWVSVRLTGKQPLDLNDLAEIAGGLGVEVTDLLPNRVPQHLPTRQYLSRGEDRPQAAAHRVPNMSRSRRPQRRNLDRIAA